MVIILVKLWYPKSNKVQDLITVWAKHPNWIVCLRHSYQEKHWSLKNQYLFASVMSDEKTWPTSQSRIWYSKHIGYTKSGCVLIYSVALSLQPQQLNTFNNHSHCKSNIYLLYFHSRIKINLLITLFVTGQIVVKKLN